MGDSAAMGNTVIAVPSERHPLAATDLFQVLETSDVPAGVVNIVTGGRDQLVPTLAEHADVDAIWHFGPPQDGAAVEAASVGNLKRTWVGREPVDWFAFDVQDALRHATQVKNIWIPYRA